MFFFKKKKPISLDQKKQEIFNRIKPIFSKQLEIDEGKIIPEAAISEDLGADSLDSIELTMALEEEFDIEIPDEEVDNMKTVDDILNYLVKTIN